MTNYREEFKAFVQSMESGAPVPAENVGRLIVKLASYFSDAITTMVKAEYAYNKKLAQLEQGVDETSGKPLSSTKAEALAKATPEYLDYATAKGETVSLEQCINSCKALQKSLQNDFSYSGM